MTITLFILLLTIGISAVALNNRKYFYKLEYNPYLVHHNKQWYRMMSHAFIHADWTHLIVNMYVLYYFGRITETFYHEFFPAMGRTLYMLLYLGGIFFAALPALKKHKDHSHYNAVGASGAVSAVLFTSILFMPTQGIRFIFVPIDIPAFVFGGLYLAFEWYMDKKSNDNVAHDAHFWGAIFGIAFTIVLAPEIGLSCIQQIAQLLGIG